jgi:hypothetical protein
VSRVFSVVNGVLLRPLPFPHPEELVALHESKMNFPSGSISYPNFRDWQRLNHTFAAMAIMRSAGFTLTGRGEAEHIRAGPRHVRCVPAARRAAARGPYLRAR